MESCALVLAPVNLSDTPCFVLFKARALSCMHIDPVENILAGVKVFAGIIHNNYTYYMNFPLDLGT